MESALLSPGPSPCEQSRANGLLSGWKQAGSQGDPSPEGLFIPTCLEVRLWGPHEGVRGTPERIPAGGSDFPSFQFIQLSKKSLRKSREGKLVLSLGEPGCVTQGSLLAFSVPQFSLS